MIFQLISSPRYFDAALWRLSKPRKLLASELMQTREKHQDTLPLLNLKISFDSDGVVIASL